MNRRQLLTGVPSALLALSTAPSWAVVDPNSLAAKKPKYGLGMRPATKLMLARIAKVRNGDLRQSSSHAKVYSMPYFDMSDDDLMAAMGWGRLLPYPTRYGQGKQGSCVAWGAGYGMMSTLYAATQGHGSPVTSDLLASPADLYAKVLNREQGNRCGNGTYISDALNVLVEEGVESLAMSPYSENFCSFPGGQQMVLDGYMQAAVNDRLAVQYSVVGFRVCPVGIQVYEDFQNLKGKTVYKGPKSGAKALGGHCLLIVGYDDGKSAYRVMNSWGTTWADRGYGWISYSAFEKIASEVYLPYAVNSVAQSSLYDQREPFGNNIITVRQGLAVTWLNRGAYTAYVSFQLDDFLRVTQYVIDCWVPTGGSWSRTRIANQQIRQTMRAGILPAGTVSTELLRKTTVISASLVGYDRYNTPTQKTLYMRYPDPGGR